MKAAVPGLLMEQRVRLSKADQKRLARVRRQPAAVAEPVVPDHARRGVARTWSVGELPLGSIRIRKQTGSSSVRMVKVRMDGPSGQRWKNFARWWWEQNRGPVSEGKRVLHRDGDTLNDDPSNLFVGTASDAIALWHYLHPKESAAQLRRCHRGAARHNRLRGRLFRTLGWVRDSWYPVDFARRLVFNDPRRERWQVYAAVAGPTEVAVPRSANGQGVTAWALGWPGVPALAACALEALHQAPHGLPLDRILEEANAIAARHGRSPAKLYGLWQALRPIPWREWTTKHGRGSQTRRYFLSDEGRRRRRPPCPFVAVRGSRLAAGECAGFEKVKPDGKPYGKRRLDEQALLELAGAGR